ncbi:MAG: hypothetical protein P8J61_02440 [Gammaproteobacteria bacterium]|jgi:hypothetical protein|nr:hypothetical protein [Gammaproteobacteria bacterium]
MSEASSETAAEKQNTSLLSKLIDTSKPYIVKGISIKLYLVIAVLAIAILELEILPRTGVTGAFAVLWTIAFLFQ